MAMGETDNFDIFEGLEQDIGLDFYLSCSQIKSSFTLSVSKGVVRVCEEFGIF